MYTKNAFKNIKNRYKAVLKKCTLLNTFGSLAMASVVFMVSAFMSATIPAIAPHSAYASTTISTTVSSAEELLTQYLEASSSSITGNTAYSYIKVESGGNFSF